MAGRRRSCGSEIRVRPPVDSILVKNVNLRKNVICKICKCAEEELLAFYSYESLFQRVNLFLAEDTSGCE